MAAAAAILDFAIGQKFFRKLVPLGWVVSTCQIWSKSDEPDPNDEPKCDLWGKIWLILDFWPPAAILDFENNEKFFRRLVPSVK